MRFTNLKNRIFILIFLGILVFPWIGGGILRLVDKEKFQALSVVEKSFKYWGKYFGIY